MGRWSKCGVLIEMALVVHANKTFISEVVEKEQHHISDSPKTLNESIIHSYTYFNSNPFFRVTCIRTMSGF
jgi:hypothetical protein